MYNDTDDKKAKEPDQSDLERIKKIVQSSRSYFSSNNDNFNKSKEFLFVSTLNTDDQSKLSTLGRPALRFNVIEAYVSRLRGEFAIQNPDIDVEPVDGDPEGDKVANAVSNIIRGIFYESQADNIDNHLYKDILGGGFAVLEIYTDYKNDETFDQKICIDCAYDPTLVGFDPSAKKPHKGDGNYCYKLVPMREEEFKALYKDVEINYKNLSYIRDDKVDFSWSYTMPKDEKIIYVCDFYEKQYKNIVMVKTSDGEVMPKDAYDALTKIVSLSGEPVIPPEIKETRKRRVLDKVCRYRLIENKIIEVKDTEYPGLPLIFFDGDSVFIHQKQITRPYAHNAFDAQRAKNIIASTLLDEIQNMRRTTLIIDERAIPSSDAFRQPYINPDRVYGSYVYTGVDKNNNPIPPPTPLQRTAIPPEISNTFQMMDPLIQSELGAYDAALGIQGNNLSGKALIAGATNSNAAAKPYVMNFIASMNQVARMLIAMIPKYYITPRTIPIIDEQGKRSYQRINDPLHPNNVQLDYSPNDLNVYVSEGVSFHAQKQESLQTMVQLAQALPGMTQLLSGPGLPTVLDNLDIRGGATLKTMAEEQIKNQQQAAQAAANQPQPPNQAQLKMAELQMNNANKQKQFQIDEKNLQLQEKELIVKLLLARQDAQSTLQRSQTEHERAQADLEIKRIDQALDLYKFHVEKHHDLAKEEKAAERDAKALNKVENPFNFEEK